MKLATRLTILTALCSGSMTQHLFGEVENLPDRCDPRTLRREGSEDVEIGRYR